MLVLPLLTLLAVAGDPLPPPPAPRPARVATATPTQGFNPALAPLPTMGTGNLWLPGLALVGLAGLTLTLRRRKMLQGSRYIEVLETAGLGPRRSLIVVRMGEETLLLGSSEGGITLLKSQAADLRPAPSLAPAPDMTPSEAPAAKTLPAFINLLGFRRKEEPTPSFESLLAESPEDQELRRKLASGLGARAQR